MALYVGDTKYKVMIGNQKEDFKVPLPYDAEVEWLESDGNQYIDLGVKAKTTSKIEVKFNLSSNATKAVYGSAEPNYGMFFGTSATGAVFCNFTNTAISPSRTLSKNTDYTVVQYGTSLLINSWSNNVQAIRTTTYTLALFARKLSGDVQRNIEGKIYYCKFYDGNELLLDLIPVRKNGVGYMYDNVNGLLFSNAGSGSFTYGNDVTT